MTYAVPALTALLGTLTLMVSLRPLAVHIQLTDKPGGRKHHVGEIPLVGGIAMFVGIVVGVSVVAGGDGSTWYFVWAGALLVVVGTLDDRQSLPCLVRLAAQVGAALIMIVGGNLVIADIGNPFGTGIIHLGPAAIAGSVLITVTIINAFNFIDGVDGLAGCIALVAVSAGALAGGWAAPSTVIAMVVAAAIIGFLIFNFPRVGNNPVRTFMGDAGSTLLGLVVVWLTITITQGEARHISPVIGLWFALIPIADFFSCFVQRIARGKSPLSPGREHFHHALLRAGLSSRQVLGILTSMAALYAGIGLLGAAISAPDVVMFSLWLALGASQYWIVKWIALRIIDRRQDSELLDSARPGRGLERDHEASSAGSDQVPVGETAASLPRRRYAAPPVVTLGARHPPSGD